jgi:hypothetical protein
MSVTDYSKTASSNTSIDSTDISEGCSPAGINNAIRSVMKDIAEVVDGTTAMTAFAVDNLKLDGNTLSSTDTNGNIVLDPNGTGSVDLDGAELILDADGDTSITADTDDRIDFKTAGTDRMHITSTGNVGIGVSAPTQELEVNGEIFINPSSGDARLIFDAGAGSGWIGAPSSDTDSVRLYAPDNDQVLSYADNELRLYAGNTDRVRIGTSGNFAASGTGHFTSLQSVNNTSERSMFYGSYLVIGNYNDVCQIWNRSGSDGDIVHIRAQGSTEGKISVSGTTVSFTGGHLSRWSRLADNSKDTSIVKGTVMTNLDKMVVWTDDDGNTEDNEQLNCMAVSSVEGDTNVAGVMVNWDEEDDFNDMNIAMTGDMVIRIAQGTTVARGDLLMSAGDGTAKPQGDDIVRSKTIAKVTSTNVSHTYSDGSYLVPCVLMAC